MKVTIIPAVRVFAWTGAAVFVGALGYFLFSYWFRFASAAPGPGAAAAIAWNTTIFSIFALHHSVFARERVRAWIARIVPPGLERSVYVWVASVLFILVCALWQPVGGVVWQVHGWPRWGLVALQLFGVWLSVRAASAIDVFELAGLRPHRPAAAAPVEFKTTGPYGWVRHPIYSGWFLIVFSVETMTATRLVFAVVSSLYVLVAIPFEERSLRATTGGAYNTYAGQVKWKLVPGIY
jgi:protein-S-isoprenylcysteine O-methyltransferase Ste14